jgi:Schlafen, AlbA_2
MRTLTSWESLQPLVGTTSESADLDFKATLDPKKDNKIEFAKDVAALANVLGGHVLFGVSTDLGGTRCKGFHGVEVEIATKITEVFEQQVKDRCRPTPICNTRSFSLPGSPKVVVVVAVEASPLAPVGVNLHQDNGGILVNQGWAFPFRVGSLTQYLHPDQFGVYESMNSRRAAAILNSIPENERQQVCLSWPTRSLPPAGHSVVTGRPIGTMKVQFICVDLLGNVASFIEPDRQCRIDLPLDQIRTVWRRTSSDSQIWEVSILGQVREEDGEWRFWPTS